MPYNSDPMNLSAGTQIGSSFLPRVSDDERRRRALAAQTVDVPGTPRFTVTGGTDALTDSDKGLYAEAFRKKLADFEAARQSERMNGQDAPITASGGLVGGPTINQRQMSLRPQMAYSDLSDVVERRRAEEAARSEVAAQRLQNDESLRVRQAEADIMSPLDRERMSVIGEERGVKRDERMRKQSRKDRAFGMPAISLPEGQAGPVREAVPGLLDGMNLSPQDRYAAELAADNDQPLPDFAAQAARRRLTEAQTGLAERQNEIAGLDLADHQTPKQIRREGFLEKGAQNRLASGDYAGAAKNLQSLSGMEGLEAQDVLGTIPAPQVFAEGTPLGRRLNEAIKKGNQEMLGSYEVEQLVAAAVAAGVQPENAEAYVMDALDKALPKGGWLSWDNEAQRRTVGLQGF